MQAGHLHDLNPDAAGVIYEVRVYSLEAASLGQVLHAKQIRAAHCLTSVQFSPTSEHLLLAYGRSAFTLYMHAVIHWLVCSFILSHMCSSAHACWHAFSHPKTHQSFMFCITYAAISVLHFRAILIWFTCVQASHLAVAQPSA